ncbi:MAG: methylenetetrahydrofolate reductase, partial [Clostridia bacterium]|nr:methylenetetrahydrofolate reductase [Clostridia bacterium]
RTAASAARPAVAAQAAAAAAPPMRNRFRERLRAGHPVLLAELDPPAGADPGMVPAFAAAYRDAGADIVTVADNPLGSARADVGVTAARVRRECGVDAMPHLACRDRNLLAIRSQLIALHNEGIRNLLAVTGDPVPADLAASARGVFHLNSVQLLDFIMNLNRSLFDGDGFHVGAALNLGAQRFEPELEKARRKVEAGAAFLITQPVFGGDGLRRLGEARDACLGVPLIAGILPVVSHRNALFLNNEVHGIRIPDSMVEAFRDLPRDEAAALGVRYAVDTIRDAAGLADGFHLMTPFRRTEMVARILRETRAALPAYQ